MVWLGAIVFLIVLVIAGMWLQSKFEARVHPTTYKLSSKVFTMAVSALCLLSMLNAWWAYVLFIPPILFGLPAIPNLYRAWRLRPRPREA